MYCSIFFFCPFLLVRYFFKLKWLLDIFLILPPSHQKSNGPAAKGCEVEIKGRTIRNPEGGGGENSPQKIRAKKNAWKKIRASKQQSANSLEKQFLQRLNALKKNPADT